VALLFTGASIGKLALDEVGALYWTVSASSGAEHGLGHRMQDRADTVLAKGQNPIGAVAVDASHVYFHGLREQRGAIRRVPREGGTVEECFRCDPAAMRRRCGSTRERLLPRRLFRQLIEQRPCASHEQDRLQGARALERQWQRRVLLRNGGGRERVGRLLELDGDSSPYGIFRANADGTGFRAVDSSNDRSWLALRVDDVAVYYWHSGASSGA